MRLTEKYVIQKSLKDGIKLASMKSLYHFWFSGKRFKRYQDSQTVFYFLCNTRNKLYNNKKFS